MKAYTEYLKCDFTDTEIADMARELARANQRRGSLEQQKKQVDSQLKAEIEEQNSTIGRLSSLVSSGCEYRNVECQVMLDTPEPGRKRVVRLDTGEEVKVCQMTDADRQMALDLAEQAEEAEAPTEQKNGVIVTPPPLLQCIDAPAAEPEVLIDGAPLATATNMGGTHQRKPKR